MALWYSRCPSCHLRAVVASEYRGLHFRWWRSHTLTHNAFPILEDCEPSPENSSPFSQATVRRPVLHPAQDTQRHLVRFPRVSTICEGVSSGRQHRAKVEGVHRTMNLVQQTPPFGVRCGDPRSRKEKENEGMNLKLVVGCRLTEL
jgi:hypothetical protein